jgi:uncharacterized protein (DUF2164 family)
MTPSLHLFELIKSLSASEKRYFKLYATAIGGKENSAYLKLFDAIDKLEVYDEKLLKEQFKKERFIKQLSVLKNYLLQLILKSLLHSNGEVFPTTKLQLQVAIVELLFEKGLHNLCLNIIKRVKEVAWKQEEFFLVDKLCDWEGRISLSNLGIEDVKQLINEQMLAVQKRLLDLQKKKAALDAYAVLSSDNSTTENLSEVKQMIKKIQKENISNYKGGSLGKYYYHASLNILSASNNNNIDRLHYAKLAIKALEENDNFLQANLRLYIGMIYNYSNALLSTDNTEALRKFLQKTKPVVLNINETLHKEQKYVGLTILLNVEILLYINGKQQQFPEKIDKSAKWLINESKGFVHAFHLLELCQNMIHFHFLQQKFESTLYYLNVILNHQNYKQRIAIYRAAKLWELILHQELKNAIYLQNICDSTMRFFKREKKLSLFDKELIAYIKQDNIEKKELQRIQLLEIYKHESTKPNYSLLHSFLDIEMWLLQQ